LVYRPFIFIYYFRLLLERDPNARLGAKGYKEVMEHPWFEGVEFDDIYKKNVKAPFKPIIKRKIAEKDKDITAKAKETFVEFDHNAQI